MDNEGLIAIGTYRKGVCYLSRKLFMTLAAIIALLVGSIALCAPQIILVSKGIINNLQTEIWAREVGVLLISIGSMAFMMRGEPDSRTMKIFLIGNFLVQAGLFPIELLAWNAGTIPLLSGILPNTVLHGILAVGFAGYAVKIKQ
jgi:hypothetical protein